LKNKSSKKESWRDWKVR